MSTVTTLPILVAPPVRLNETTLRDQEAVVVVALSGGTAVAVWHSATGQPDQYEVMARILDENGNPTGPEFRVNSFRFLDQVQPQVTALQDGGFVVVWQSYAQDDFSTDGYLYGLYGQRFDATGGPVGDEFPINQETLESQERPVLQPLAGGGFMVSWYTAVDYFYGGNTRFGGQFVRIFDADMQPVSGDIRISDLPGNWLDLSKFIPLSTGGFAVVRHAEPIPGNGHFYEFSIRDAAGDLVTEGTRFGLPGDLVYNGEVTELVNGNLVLSWVVSNPDGQRAVHTQVVTATGVPITAPVEADTIYSSPWFQTTALADGGFLLCWSTYGNNGVYGANRLIAQIFGADGQPRSGEIAVTGPLEASLSQVRQLAGGEILITWDTINGYYGRLIEPDGTLHATATPLYLELFGASGADLIELESGRLLVVNASAAGHAFADVSDVFVQQVDLAAAAFGNAAFTTGRDQRQLTPGADLFRALGGDDVVIAARTGSRIAGDTGSDFLVGSDAADRLYGNTGDDTLVADRTPEGGLDADILFGGAGDDLLMAYRGRDSLYGDDGNDRIIASRFIDLVDGGAGDDFVSGGLLAIGGEGNDTLSFERLSFERMDGGAGIDQLEIYNDLISEGYPFLIPVTVDLRQTIPTAGSSPQLKFAGIENVVVKGIVFSHLFGNEGANRLEVDNGHFAPQTDKLSGRGGDDTLISAGGDDMLDGGLGADLLDGGDGFDTARYEQAAEGVRVSLHRGFGQQGEAAGDVLIAIEGLTGSAFRDVFIGSAADNLLDGRAGTDYLYGMDGSDTLDGGAGNDVLDGGAGFDVVRFAGSVSAKVDLARTTTQNTWNGFDRLISIEGVIGGTGADWLSGDDQANTLEGREGSDVLTGRGGADVFVFTLFAGIDRIADFADGEDLIDLRKMELIGMEELVIAKAGTDTMIRFLYSYEPMSIRLTGVDHRLLDETDFLF